MSEDPGLRSYRRFLVAFVLVAAAAATTVGAVLLLRGHGFYGFLALAVVAFLMLLVQGYRADERERNR